MLDFRVLGPLDLRGAEDEEVRAVLTQPKRLALLAYLSVAAPGALHRRDKLVSIFWPELDQEHARNSLSQALRFLRRSVGDDVIVSRGADEVGVDDGLLRCDAVSFVNTVGAGEMDTALRLYRGDLLEGFFLADCPEFERWLEGERERLREMAAGAAWSLANQFMESARLTDAERMAQRALGLVCTDENEVRRFIEAIAGAGDRAAAIRFFERFAERLSKELDLEPSVETRELIERIRGRSEASEVEEEDAVSGQACTDPPVEGLAGGGMVRSASLADDPSSVFRRQMRWTWPPIVGLLLIAAGYLAFFRGGGAGPPESPADHRVAVLPLQNRTGDPSLDPIGPWAAAYVSEGLVRAEIVRHVVSLEDMAVAAHAAIADGGPSSSLFQTWPEETGADMAVLGAFYSVGDSLQFRLRIVDRDDTALGSVPTVSGSAQEPSAALPGLQTMVLGALARVVVPGHDLTWSIMGRQPPRPEALEPLQEGLRLHWSAQFAASIPHFERAAELDPDYLVTMQWLTVAYVNVGRAVEADSLCQILEGRFPEMTHEQRLKSERECAVARGDPQTALHVSRSMTQFGSLYWYWVGFHSLGLNRPREAVEAFSKYDPNLSRRSWEWSRANWAMWARALHLLGDHERELEIARQGRERFPDFWRLVSAEIRALIALGRLEEAEGLVEEWRGWQLPGESPYRVLIVAAQELDAHGHPALARPLLERLLDWYSSRPPEVLDTPGNKSYRAFFLLALDRNDEAEALLNSYVDETADYYPIFLLGIVAARRGDREEAERISEALRTLDRPLLNGRNTRFRALIMGTLGDVDEAVRLLEQALEEGWRIWQAHPHIEFFLKDLRGNPVFEEFVTPKG